jgi:hypothetical protein
MWEPRRPATLWASTAYYRDNFTFYIHLIIFIYLVRSLKVSDFLSSSFPCHFIIFNVICVSLYCFSSQSFFHSFISHVIYHCHFLPRSSSYIFFCHLFNSHCLSSLRTSHSCCHFLHSLLHVLLSRHFILYPLNLFLYIVSCFHTPLFRHYVILLPIFIFSSSNSIFSLSFFNSYLHILSSRHISSF